MYSLHREEMFRLGDKSMFTLQLYISHIGGVISTASILAALCLFLYVQGYRKQIDTIVFSACLAMSVTYTLKYMLGVPRPLEALVLETDGRFPSGHATVAAVVMGLGVYYGSKIHRVGLRRVVYALSILWFFLIAYSRVYLGVHVLLDVVAGGLIGVVAVWVSVQVFKHLRYYR